MGEGKKNIFSKTQWPYLRFWLTAVVLAEGIMLIFSHDLFLLYLFIGIVFAGGFLLRVFRLYPGQPEPFILDGSAIVIAVLLAFASRGLGGSAWRFALILCSSVIILPHLVYILKEK